MATRDSGAQGPRRIRMIVAYDGRLFRGWQSQSAGGSIQDHLETAFEKICGLRIPVQGAGRTDAGVHALAQSAHADLPSSLKLPLARLTSALNAHLPPQIRIARCAPAPPGFHARLSAHGKIYVYRIWNDSFLPPLELGRAWLVPGDLDRNILRRTAAQLTGRHDFAGFAANRGRPQETTIRTISEITVRETGKLVALRFRGDGFLYRMVRLMTGTMVRCAQGKASPAWITDLLAAKGAFKTSFAAPAEGLYLNRVLY